MIVTLKIKIINTHHDLICTKQGVTVSSLMKIIVFEMWFIIMDLSVASSPIVITKYSNKRISTYHISL